MERGDSVDGHPVVKFEVMENGMEGSPVLKRMRARLDKDAGLLDFADMRPITVDLDVRFELGGLDKLHGFRLIGDPHPDRILSIRWGGHKQMRADYRSEDWEEQPRWTIQQRWFMNGALVILDRRLSPSSRYLAQFSECCKTIDRFLIGMSTTLGKGSGAFNLSWSGEMKREGSSEPMRFSLVTQMIRDHGQVTYGIQSGQSSREDAVNWP